MFARSNENRIRSQELAEKPTSMEVARFLVLLRSENNIEATKTTAPPEVLQSLQVSQSVEANNETNNLQKAA